MKNKIFILISVLVFGFAIFFVINRLPKNVENIDVVSPNAKSSEFIYKDNATGENLTVVYFEKDEKSFVSIKGDGETNVVLSKTNDSNGVYVDNNNVWISEGRKVTFTRSKQNVSMVLLSPIDVTYQGVDGIISITYLQKGSLLSALLKKDGLEMVLTQVKDSASAHGAEYVNGSTSLSVNNESVVLTMAGRTSHYSSVSTADTK